MALINPHARGNLQLRPRPTRLPHYRSDFNPDTHHIFSSEVVLVNSGTRHYASVSVPKSLLTDDISLDGPVRVEGPLAMHLINGAAVEFQIDVDWICGGADPFLSGHLHVELLPESDADITVSTQDRKAWVVRQVHPQRRQFWLNRHPVQSNLAPGLYEWFPLSGYWTTREAAPSDFANFCPSDCLLPQQMSYVIISEAEGTDTPTILVLPPDRFADALAVLIDAQTRYNEGKEFHGVYRGVFMPFTAFEPHLEAGPAVPPQIIHLPALDPTARNDEVEAALPAPQDDADVDVDPVLPLAIPPPLLQQRAPRRRPTPGRLTNRQALDLRIKGHKLERALKQLGAEHMSRHITTLLATTKPGSTTRSKHRASVQFSTGPLVGTRAQRRQLAAAA